MSLNKVSIVFIEKMWNAQSSCCVTKSLVFISSCCLVHYYSSLRCLQDNDAPPLFSAVTLSG